MSTDTMIEPKLVKLRITNPKKAGIYTIGPYWDREKKMYRKLAWSSGEERVYKLNGTALSDVTLNLNDPDDKLLHEFVKDHPRFVKRPEPLIVLQDIGAETNEKIDYEEQSLEAKIVVKDLMSKDLANFARLFGIPTENVTEKTVKLALYEVADNDPKRVLEVWNDPERQIKEMLERGLAKNVFTRDSHGVWKYNQILMGTNFEQALMWLKDESNEDILPKIRKDIEKITE